VTQCCVCAKVCRNHTHDTSTIPKQKPKECIPYKHKQKAPACGLQPWHNGMSDQSCSGHHIAFVAQANPTSSVAPFRKASQQSPRVIFQTRVLRERASPSFPRHFSTACIMKGGPSTAWGACSPKRPSLVSNQRQNYGLTASKKKSPTARADLSLKARPHPTAAQSKPRETRLRSPDPQPGQHGFSTPTPPQKD
jgi:hypothetical protein